MVVLLSRPLLPTSCVQPTRILAASGARLPQAVTDLATKNSYA
jgi:hypothetical protein